MSKVAFLTTIFPMNEGYLHDFFDSLQKQTYKFFDVVVVNDGFKNLSKFQKEYFDLNIIEIISTSSIAKNRELGINYAINHGYDVLVFGDSDDFFSENRVEKSLEFLNQYDVVVNDLTLFNEKNIYEQKYISNRINNKMSIQFDFIKEKNIFGLSNTAIKLKNVELVSFPEDLIAVDWYFFTLCLLKKHTAIFTNETETFYRQHHENTIGLGKLDADLYRKGINIKKKHFENIHILFPIFNNELASIQIKELNLLKEKNVIKNIIYPLWWEEI